MYPIWSRVKGLRCSSLRLALYTATGNELVRLKAAFPECFGGVKKGPGVPVSVIREETRINALAFGHKEGTPKLAYSSELWWSGSGVIVSHRIPIAYSWTWETERWNSTLYGKRGDDSVPFLPFPKDVWNQVRCKPLAGGMRIAHNGELFVVVYYSDYGQWILGKPIMKKNEPTVQVVHSSFIDLHS